MRRYFYFRGLNVLRIHVLRCFRIEPQKAHKSTSILVRLAMVALFHITSLKSKTATDIELLY